MNITDVKIRKVGNSEGKLKAIASIVIDNSIAIHDIRIIDGDKGLFIGMPARKFSDGEFNDIAHPVNTETRVMLQDMILTKYCEVNAK